MNHNFPNATCKLFYRINLCNSKYFSMQPLKPTKVRDFTQQYKEINND